VSCGKCAEIVSEGMGIVLRVTEACCSEGKGLVEVERACSDIRIGNDRELIMKDVSLQVFAVSLILRWLCGSTG
jgi:hypothetical protein